MTRGGFFNSPTVPLWGLSPLSQQAAELALREPVQLGSRTAERTTPAVALKFGSQLPVGFGRAVSLPFPLRIGRKVAIHFVLEIRAETAMKTGFGLPLDITPGTVLRTVPALTRAASVWAYLAEPNASCFGHLGRSKLA
jgi:hypothetical protein